jgi:hypothetical protein
MDYLGGMYVHGDALPAELRIYPWRKFLLTERSLQMSHRLFRFADFLLLAPVALFAADTAPGRIVGSAYIANTYFMNSAAGDNAVLQLTLER